MDKYPVSVVIPAFNAEKTLERAVKSALDAGAREVVVVDDGSTDRTPEIREAFVYTSVTWITNPFRCGTIYSRNRAIHEAGFNLIVPLDADDQMIDLGALVEAYEPGRWVYGGWREDDHEIEPPPPGALHRKELGWVTMLFHKDDWRRVGGYDPDFSIGNEIWAFQCALTCAGVMPKRIPNVVFERNTDASRTQRARAWTHVIKALVKDKYPDLPPLREPV